MPARTYIAGRRHQMFGKGATTPNAPSKGAVASAKDHCIAQGEEVGILRWDYYPSRSFRTLWSVGKRGNNNKSDIRATMSHSTEGLANIYGFLLRFSTIRTERFSTTRPTGQEASKRPTKGVPRISHRRKEMAELCKKTLINPTVVALSSP